MSDVATMEGVPAATADPQGGVRVEFFSDPVEDYDCIRFFITADKTFQPIYRVDERYKRDWPRQWAAYQAGKDQLAGQTRLEGIGWIDEGSRNLLASHHVLTLEGLAQMNDGAVTMIALPNIRTMRKRALEEIDAKEKAAGYDELKTEIAALKAQLSGQSGESQPKPRRGRPPKAEVVALTEVVDVGEADEVVEPSDDTSL